MKPIVVYGATGFTGRLVAQALRASGAQVIVAGRDRAKLERLHRELALQEPPRVATLDNAGSLRAAFKGAGCVVNCAGPFLRFGRPVIEAALAEGAHYVDSTGEQVFAKQTRDTFDATARERGVTIVNMLAFEYALGDMIAHVFLDGRSAEELAILYRVRHGVASAGTKKSILEVTSRKGYQHVEGGLRAESAASRTRVFIVDGKPTTSFSFPGGEVLTVPRHARVKTVRTYWAAKPGTVRRMRALAPLARLLLKGPVLRFAERRVERAHVDPTPEERAATTFTLAFEAEGVSPPARFVARGRDPYALTADLLALGATRLASGAPAPRGVVAPAEVLDPVASLAQLRERHPSLTFGPA